MRMHIGHSLLILASAGAVMCAQVPPSDPPEPMHPGPACPMQPPPPPGAEGPGRHFGQPGPMHAPMPWPELRFLGLTEAQKKSVREILEKRRPAQEAKHRAAAEKEMALREALEDPSTTEARLRSLHAAASEARFQAALEQQALVKEIHVLLSPEQQAKAKRIREKRQKEMEAHRDFMEETGEPEPGAPHRP